MFTVCMVTKMYGIISLYWIEDYFFCYLQSQVSVYIYLAIRRTFNHMLTLIIAINSHSDY